MRQLPDLDEESRAKIESDAITPAPRWVKVFGGVLLAILMVFVILHLAGGGFRGHGA
jgi:hypothetical protein